jgi:hypothetical protein
MCVLSDHMSNSLVGWIPEENHRPIISTATLASHQPLSSSLALLLPGLIKL